ncbi:MAG: hypothetical protein WKF87_08585 [Chryseolinea sp.]
MKGRLIWGALIMAMTIVLMMLIYFEKESKTVQENDYRKLKYGIAGSETLCSDKRSVE